jgi:hypothetical protein
VAGLGSNQNQPTSHGWNHHTWPLGLPYPCLSTQPPTPSRLPPTPTAPVVELEPLSGPGGAAGGAGALLCVLGALLAKAAAVGAGAAHGVGAAQGHNVLVSQAHAVEHVAQVLQLRGSSRRRMHEVEESV